MTGIEGINTRQALLGGQLALGAVPLQSGMVSFRVWAPSAASVGVEVVDGSVGTILLQRDGEYFEGIVTGKVGDRYWYWIDGSIRRPDPVSRSQPDGVHGPSQIIDPAFAWTDDEWHGIVLDECIFYELHVGTFTPEGTFDAAIERLDYLQELGITVVELMPIAQFPGTRNWGYDGVFPFAPQGSYGGAAGLKRFINACHQRGLAVFLDVVYNHLGPEGNYLHAFGPYFTDRYRTPWGDAVNFDGPFSDGVRHYFIANALYWIAEYHFDGLRLDAVHGIFDFSACHVLAELAGGVHALASDLGRPAYVIAESDLNDPRLITDRKHGGFGLDAQWSDDFHHALHTLLTQETRGYYADFVDFSQLVTALRDSFVYAGNYSRYRQRCHGAPAAHLPPNRFVVFSQNHDQVGNRPQGERLTEHLSPEQLKLALATVLLSPYLPLIFMGEEYGEDAPFPYFTSFSDLELVEAVRCGRQLEFSRFGWSGEIPDPQAENTFKSALIDPSKRHIGEHSLHYAFAQEVIRLRKSIVSRFPLSREGIQIEGFDEEKVLMVRWHSKNDEILSLFNFSDTQHDIKIPCAHGSFKKILDSLDSSHEGSGLQEGLVSSGIVEFQMLHVAPWGVYLHEKEQQ